MRITIFLTLACIVNAFATGYSQERLSIDLNNVKLSKVFDVIQHRTDYQFLYNDEDVMKAPTVSISLKDATVPEILANCFKNYPLSYSIENKTVVILQKKPTQPGTANLSNEITRAEFTVSGNVTDSLGKPLVGVSVSLKGSASGSVTDGTGHYSLTLDNGNGTLVFSYVGYLKQEIVIGSRTVINVIMHPNISALDQLVVVGYGTQKKVNLTGAVSSIDYTQEANSRPLVDATQALGGLAPGLQVMQGTGNPYAEGFSVNIRGIGTLNNSAPLVLVDGMEQSISNVNPNDIATISVLKDAASCAIYGNRGANGVILITTKSGGKNEKLSVMVSSKVSLNSPMREPRLVSNYAEYMQLINESYTNLGRSAAFSDETINLWKEKSKDPNSIAESGYPNYVAYPNTDWYKTIYENSLMQEHTVQVSGGSKKTGFDFSFTYEDNPGILQKSGYKRYFIRSNIYSDVTDWLRIGSRIWGYNTDRDRIGTGSLTSIDMTKVVPGTYPYYDGKYGAPEANEEDPQSHNPLWDMNFEHGDMNYMQIFTNFYTSVKFLKHFTYDFGFWYKRYIYDGKYASNAFPKWSFSLDEITAQAIDLKTATTGQTYNRENFWKFNHVLNYNQTFGKHDVTAMAGFEEERYWARTSNVTMQGLIDPSIDDIDVGTEFKSSYGASDAYTARSWFGRATYAYNSRYLFEADIRGDGSSRFAPGHRWGVFPAVSAGWRLSQENFMAGTRGWVDNVKLRASWGKLGNNSIGDYEWQQVYGLVNYPFASNTNLGLAPTAQANVNLQWEKSTTTDFGLDFDMVNSKLSGSIDYYNRVTSGILYRPSIMLIYGNITAARQNIAEVTNQGIEVQLTWKNHAGNFHYSISGNVAYNANSVSKYKGRLVTGWTDDAGQKVYQSNIGDVSTGGTNRILEGHIINEYYMLQPYNGSQHYFNQDGSVNPSGGPRSGMIRTEDDMRWLNAMVAAGYKFYPNQTVGKDGIWYGDYVYADKNGDGIYGNTYDNVFTGTSSMPKLNFGAQLSGSWKGFDLSMNWYGVSGNMLYFYRTGQNASTTIKGYAIGQGVANDHYFYDPENPTDSRTDLTSDNPRLTNNSGSSQSESTNTHWLYSGNFLKLKNLTLGYSIPMQIVGKIHAQDIRVYFSGENLLTITNYPGIDPEMRTSIEYLTYRQLSFGVNVTF